ncbi:hypothetical protein JCM10212_006343 [Sporobolomyces blumeae]
MSTERPAFRPHRTRASLGSVPTSAPSTTPTPLLNNKENGLSTLDPRAASTSTEGARHRKRAQSLGGDALEQLRKRTRLADLKDPAAATLSFELSPNRAERRRAVPRRSILKTTPAVFENATLNFGPGPKPSLDASSHTTDLSSLSAFHSHPSQAQGRNAQPVPTRRRSSIKPRTSTASGQYDDSDDDDDDDDDEDDPNGSLDMDITRMDVTTLYDRDGRRMHRASHSRRVSFAPSANVRHFTPDKPTAQAQNAAAARAAAHAAALAAAERAGDESFASNGTEEGREEDESESEPEEDEDLQSEPSMEIAGDEITLAFKGHFAGTQLPISAVKPELERDDDETGLARHQGQPEEGDDEEDDDDGEQAMEDVTSDMTGGAWGQATAVLNSQSAAAASALLASASIPPLASAVESAAAQTPASRAFELFGTGVQANAPDGTRGSGPELDSDISRATTTARGPRFSVVARQEDDEDEEIMRSLGFAKGGKPRKSRVAPPVPVVDARGEDRDAADGDGVESDDDARGDEDDVSDMDVDAGDGDETVAMEMTTAIGRLIDTSVPSESTGRPEHALSTGADDEDEDADDDDDDEAEEAEVSMQLIGPGAAIAVPSHESTTDVADMMETTTSYGSILSAPLPRPSLAPQPQIEASPVAQLSSPSRSRSVSPAKSSGLSATAFRGPSPGPVRAVSVPLGGQQPGTPAKSPFRRSYGYGSGTARPSSPLPSPRRVLRPTPSPGPPSTMPPRSPLVPHNARARSRSASPVKPTTTTTTTTTPFLPPSSLAAKSPRATLHSRLSRLSASPVKSSSIAAASGPRPSLAARSPGGSLSLKGLMAQQQAVASHKAEAPSAVPIDEENVTQSDFEASFEQNAPRPLASIEEFFAETGTEFVNDIAGMSGGFDLDQSRMRRKSLAAAAVLEGGKERAAPTFADLAVAGACQSLFYELYRNDQQRLVESMQEVQQIYNEIHTAVEAGEIPQVFKDWATASDDAKAQMKRQFAQIKLYYSHLGKVEWKSTRNENMGRVIEVMEQNLASLREDRAVLAEFDLGSVVPSLEERHAALHAELMLERALDHELSTYSEDQREELEQLQAAIEEQDEQINGNRTKGIVGARPQFERIEQQLQKDRNVLETEREKETTAKARIVELEAALKDKRTKADLARMNAELEALQNLHGWTLLAFAQTQVTLVHFDELRVELELDRRDGLVTKCNLTVAGGKRWMTALARDVAAFLISRIAARVAEEIGTGRRQVRYLVRLISNLALVARHVRHEIALASLDYPIRFDPTSDSLHLEVYSPSANKAFEVTVSLDEVELDLGVGADKSRWAEHLSAEVRVQFGGSIGSAGLAINERLNDCEGIVAALRAGEQACALAV